MALPVDLTGTDYAALNYFLQGKSLRVIYEELGVTPYRMSHLLDRPAVKELFSGIKNTQKKALEAGAELVVQTINELLKHSDGHIRLGAVTQWAKMMGWSDSRLKVQFEVGAEEVAAALIKGGTETEGTPAGIPASPLAQEFTGD
jgi:hypothetical protein